MVTIFRFDHKIAENQQFKVFSGADCGASPECRATDHVCAPRRGKGLFKNMIILKRFAKNPNF